ncbi:MAG: hypothetical protein ACFCVK_10070 [Acidimicrobiales bacterium]
MNHGDELADRAAGLLLSIRPSLARMMGLDVVPADLLDENGIAGWGLGMSQLLQDLDPSDAGRPLGPAIGDWLERELRSEGRRWRAATAWLWQLDLILRTTTPSPGDEAVVAAWTSNVDAAVARGRRHSLVVSAADRRRCAAVIRRLRARSHTSALVDALGELSELEPTTSVGAITVDPATDLHPEVPRLLSRVDRRLLTGWLSGAAVVQELVVAGGRDR